MYYNRILRQIIVDPFDYFLIFAIFGSFSASYLKEYLSEKKAMERLKNSILKKSELAIQSNRPNLSSRSKAARIQKIYKFALENRGGEFDKFPENHEFSNQEFQIAEQIKRFVERLAHFLKQRELKGIAKIFFKNGRLILELILYTCRIDITYLLLNEGLNTQVIVITATAGGAFGFMLSWFSVGASLVAPPVLISTLFLRSLAQQVINQIEYAKFKKFIQQMVEDDELRETIRVIFMESEVPPTTAIEPKSLNSDKNPLGEFDFEEFVKRHESKEYPAFKEAITAKVEEEFGLIENPSSEQIAEIIERRKIHRKTQGKTVYFKDFIEKLADSSDSDDIINAEIVKETRKVQVKNDEF